MLYFESAYIAFTPLYHRLHEGKYGNVQLDNTLFLSFSFSETSDDDENRFFLLNIKVNNLLNFQILL